MWTYPLTTFRYDAETQTFGKKTVEREIGVHEIMIETTHSGLCYTDVHAKGKGCGLGHEGVGIICGMGEAVKGMSVGDRVGWGWLRASCGRCLTCLDGYRQYCAEARGFAFCDTEQGAFGDFHIIDAAFAYEIPDTISSKHAAVLMCAGASTYEALKAAETKPSDVIGVVGLGGLGHMAVLFAKAMGCHVTVLTRSMCTLEQKEKDAFELGADQIGCFHEGRPFTRNNPDFEPAGQGRDTMEHYPINVLLICGNATPDFEKILPLLARRAVIVLMSIQDAPLNIPYMSFVLPGHKLLASTEASTRNHIEMLEFADRHNITPWVEEFLMTERGLQKAFARLENGLMRYRGVLKVP